MRKEEEQCLFVLPQFMKVDIIVELAIAILLGSS